MFVSLVIASVLGLLAEKDVQSEFSLFIKAHGKSYDPKSLRKAYTTFRSNLEFIREHNANIAEHGFEVGVNKFADLTGEEFSKVYKGYNGKNRVAKNEAAAATAEEIAALPASVDWRTQGYVTPVKDQGQCGSCWAFSTTGSVEGAWFAKNKKLVSLSESNLVDCSTKEGNMGCDGGLMDQAFEYIISNKGIDTESSYPYQPVDRKCKFAAANVGATITSYKDVKAKSEADLQNSIATYGPISVAIDASASSFQFYKSGVYNEKRCSSTELDHGVLAVGYGTQAGKDYYIVKNSWGADWGNQGYIWMSRNANNQCGIATAASWPTA